LVTSEVWSLPRIGHLGGVRCLKVKSLTHLNDAYNKSIILMEGRLCYLTPVTM